MDVSRPTLDKYFRMEGNPGTTKGGSFNIQHWLDFIKQSKAESMGSGDLKDEKLKREIEKLDIQIAMMRGDLVSIQDMNDAIVAVCRVVVDGMNEFEARASAEYPTEPRMVQVAEGITDRIKRHMQRKIEDA